MYKKSLVLLFLMILTMFIISCADNDLVNNPQKENNFIPLPLKVGNMWTYKYNNSSEKTYSVVASVNVNGQKAYKFNDDWMFDNDICYYQDGTLYGCKEYDPSGTLEVLFPKNPDIGDTWIVDQDKTLKIESKNILITVQAGKFSCYKIKFTRGDQSSYLYWGNGAGFVKSEGGEIELISFHFN